MGFADICKLNEDLFTLKFEDIKNPMSRRADLHAMLMLDKAFPGKNDMVCSAEHDQIWLDVYVEEVDEKMSESEMKDLMRCGVFYDEETDSLSMFV